jgi:hypothetical protein
VNVKSVLASARMRRTPVFVDTATTGELWRVYGT